MRFNIFFFKKKKTYFRFFKATNILIEENGVCKLSDFGKIYKKKSMFLTTEK